MPSKLTKGIVSGILAGLIFGLFNIMLGYVFNPIFNIWGMSLIGSRYAVTSIVIGVLYGLIFGGAYHVVYHSLPHRLKGMYYGLFIWAVAGVATMTDSMLYVGASVQNSILFLMVVLFSYLALGMSLEYFYERM